jgi:hypothetical protein
MRLLLRYGNLLQNVQPQYGFDAKSSSRTYSFWFNISKLRAVRTKHMQLCFDINVALLTE